MLRLKVSSEPVKINHHSLVDDMKVYIYIYYHYIYYIYLRLIYNEFLTAYLDLFVCVLLQFISIIKYIFSHQFHDF